MESVCSSTGNGGQVKLSHILPFSLQFSSRSFLKDLWRISTGAVRSGLIEMQLSEKGRISREEAQKEGDGADVGSC